MKLNTIITAALMGPLLAGSAISPFVAKAASAVEQQKEDEKGPHNGRCTTRVQSVCNA